MENGLVMRWFLGANSGAGFYSLYDSFAADDGDFLWVIKAGPGCGKSGFMKRIGAAAEEAGMAVEYIHCSGDPASLDGVYIPACKTGWVDGTAPHTLDPVFFGATGAYLNLGTFCDVNATNMIRGEISEVTKECRQLHNRAYSLLSAAAALSPGKCAGLLSNNEISAANKRAVSVAAREFPKVKKNTVAGKVTKRFLSGITCNGPVFLEDTLTALCKRIYVLDNRYGLGSHFIGVLLEEAQARGLDATLCPCPLDPSTPEALILPSLSLGFLCISNDRTLGFETYRHVRLDALVDADRARTLRPRIRANMKIESALVDAASAALRASKDLHDALEVLYNPLVDFAAVYTAADREIARVIR